MKITIYSQAHKGSVNIELPVGDAGSVASKYGQGVADALVQQALHAQARKYVHSLKAGSLADLQNAASAFQPSAEAAKTRSGKGPRVETLVEKAKKMSPESLKALREQLSKLE